uniref:DRBM domain-containing protein n=1 Tax=Dendroctonus ponderosae TaxID=77166 RepID=A0AAR5P2H8_DENPD
MLKSPVSILQELMTQRKLPSPIYTYEESDNSYYSYFMCYVDIGIQRVSASGSSRKSAKHNAAVLILNYLGIRTEDSDQLPSICMLPSPAPNHIPTINLIGKLNKLSSGHKLPHAVYIHKEILHNYQFCVICDFLEFTVEGFGFSKKTAKQDATKKMLHIIQQQGIGTIYKQIQLSESIQNAVPSNVSAIQEIDEALQKYTDIVKNMKIGTHPDTRSVLESSKDKLVRFRTWDELEMYLVDQGYTLEVTVFQPQPLMLCLKINGYTFLNFGETHEEIFQKFLSVLVNMLEQGRDLRKSYVVDLVGI